MEIPRVDKTFILVRHACSTANADQSVYREIPDHLIPLVHPSDDAGALAAGEAIAALHLDPKSVCSWFSPYLRCRQTQALVLQKAFGDSAGAIPCRESFLLREQEFGDWDCLGPEEIAAIDPVRCARLGRLTDTLGRFYFRYPNGESRADVVQRVILFTRTLRKSHFATHVVFLHGVTQRAFRMAVMYHPVEWFENERNPSNASALIILRQPDGAWREQFLTAGCDVSL
jgi:broad specificity phosphatase PhoE